MKRGISLLDLLPLPPGTQMLVPNAIADALENLAVLDHKTLSTDNFHIHHGTVRAISDMGLPALNNWPVQAPLLNQGVRFQMVRQRVQPPPGVLPANYLEPASTNFHVDLFLDKVAITIPGLTPAKLVPSSPDQAAHLVADPSRSTVRIVGGGTLRLRFSGGVVPTVFFVSHTDEIDPLAPTGPVFDLAFDPPHFFFGSSEFGATVKRLAYDGSPDFTPPEIEARNVSAAWQGLSIQEATVYMPRNARWIGDLNAGVRDLLIGSPMGLMGEIFVEFGRSPVDPMTLNFGQYINEVEMDIGGIKPEGSTARTGRIIVAPTGDVARLRAHGSPAADHTFLWNLPDGSSALGDESPWFDAHNGDTLKVTPIEVAEDETLAVSPSSEILVEFEDEFKFEKPFIGLRFEGVKYNGQDLQVENVTCVSGRAEQMDGIEFFSPSNPSGLRWTLGRAIGMPRGVGNSFKPIEFPRVLGEHGLLLIDGKERRRRAIVEVLPHGSLLIGCKGGVYRIVGDQATWVPLVTVEGLHEQDRFHATGTLVQGFGNWDIDGANKLHIPGGTLATVTVQVAAEDNPAEVPLATPGDNPIRHIQVLMDYGSDQPLNWGDAGLAEPFGIAALRAWAYQMTAAGAEIMVVGRTCDVEPNGPQLAAQRAAAAALWLTSPDQPGDLYPVPEIVHSRAETDPVDAANEAGITPPLTQGNLCAQENADLGNAFPDLPPRPAYRRVDIYATGTLIGTDVPILPNMEAQVDPLLRRVLVPGEDIQILALPEPRDSARPYRVQLKVRWDSPTVASLADAIPTLAEVQVVWQKENQMALPGANPAENVEIENVDPAGPETYTVIGRWTYDARSGATQFSLSLNNAGSPDGLFKIKNDTAATAFALGPALLSGLDAMPTDSQAVHIAALVGACGAAAKYASNGEVTFYGVTIEDRQQKLSSLKGSRWRALFDYTAQVGFEVDTSVLKLSSTKPMKIQYKGAGIEIDDSQTGLGKFALVYDDCSFDVVDPGQWTIGGTLGKLLRVVGTRAGSGSTWFEIDLGFLLDLGPVRVTQATIRVTFPTGENPLGIELRGLGVEINVPGTLKGGGRLAVSKDGGPNAPSQLSAALELNIIPAQVTARGSLQLKGKMAAIDLSLLLPVGLPLGSSGLGLFGFMGRFVANGKRDLPDVSDPVQREVDWYQKVLPEAKYTDVDAQGQYVLGLGAVIGTLPDQGFTFNAAGMLTVAFPEPEVIFGLDAKLLSKAGSPKEKGDVAAQQSMTMFGLLVFNDDAFIVGIRGAYEIPKLLKLSIPLSGYFPRKDNLGDAYFRIGADNQLNRKGDPVSITIFPGFLDYKAWAYLMVEEKSLHDLGGKDKLDLDGFSIGFGSGWEVGWSAGPIKLSASAYWMLGMGTAPLTLVGAIGVRGELSLVIISISASGEVTGRLQLIDGDMRYELDGEFKGKVDLFFFTVEGSVHFHVASGSMDEIPAPSHPLTRVDLTDRNGVVTGRAVRTGDAADPQAPPNTVWPDTVPVLQFAHSIQNALGADSPFDPMPKQLPGTVWSGTSELKYAYRLNKVQLYKKTASGDVKVEGPLDSVWWWPTHKGGLLNPNDPPPSEAEGRHLALMAWHPSPWMRNIEGGGKGTKGDPGKTAENICESPIVPVRNVALSVNHKRVDLDEIIFKPASQGTPPYPTFFNVHGKETGAGMAYGDYTAFAASKGLIVRQGKTRPFPAPVALPGENLSVGGGYEVSHTTAKYQFVKTLRFEGLFGPDLAEPAVLLAVWDTLDQIGPLAQTCDFFTGLKPRTTLSSQMVRGPLTFSSIDTKSLQAVDWVNADSKAELWLGNAGLKIQFQNPQQWVRTTVWSYDGAPVVLTAYSASNAVLDTQNLTLAPGQTATLSVATSAPNIAYVTIKGGSPKEMLPGISTGGCLLGLCWAEKVEDPSIADAMPLVSGKRPNKAQSVAWAGKQVATVAVPTGQCRLYRYTPPAGATNIWSSFAVGEFGGGRVLVLSVSGVTWTAQQLAEENEQAKEDLKDGFNGEPDPDSGLPTGKHVEKKDLLEPDTTYELRVDVQWAGWRKSDASKQPSAPDDTTQWKSFAQQAVYTFKTAAAVPVDITKPVDFKTETSFDPRGVQRYLLGFRPNGTGAPHFRDDPMKVDFNIDHLEQLLAAYGRKLVLKLRRTDPAPGSLKGFTTPANVAMDIQVVELDPVAMSPQDNYFIEVFELAPCVTPPKAGGHSLAATALLEPGGQYDLLLVAPPAASPESDELLIARAHFKASRYLDHLDLVAALGFTKDQPNAILPPDMILNAQLPSSAILASDAAMEKTLQDLGLAPWPVVKTARTVLLWQAGPTPKLAGVLLEADEPITRSGRLDIDDLRVMDGAQAKSTFTCVRSNTAGTRLLFATTSAITPQATYTLQLRGKAAITPGQQPTVFNAARHLIGQPRALLQEAQ